MREPVRLPMSRRDFCWLTAGCAAALAGCTDRGDVVDVGPLGGSSGSDDGEPDAGVEAPADAMPSGPACGTGAFDAGAPSTFALGTPALLASHNLYVVRDAGGLFAVSDRCTHENAVNAVSSGRFRCPRHGALFRFDGAIISGPVNRALVHYAMCLQPNRHVGNDTAQQVAAAIRRDA
jgi:nitrite reductase/ring-hydroxylating ferredoxin subunit